MSTHYVLKIQYVNKPPETRNIGARVTTIGREAGDIVLGDPQSSGRHAEIHFENGNVRVKDLGSTNGTFFNGQRTPEFAMQPGQGFSIGQTVMTLMAVHAAQQRPGAGKTMIAMGGMPPRPPGAPPGAPPGPPRPPGAPPAPGGFGAPPGPPPGAPPAPAGFGAPPPSSPPGAPPPGGFGAPPPSSPPGAPPMGAPPAGFGAPPPSGFGAAPPGPPPGAPPMGAPPQGGFGAPPPSSPPQGGFGAPPPDSGPPGGGFGAPPPGAPPPGGGGFGAPPDQPGGAMAPAGGAFAAAGAAMNQQQPQYGGAPQQFGGPGPMAAAPGGEIRGDFSGTGGELFGQLFVGFLLTAITFGIYMPWFQCKLLNFVASRITFGPTAKGTVRASFEGKGGELFVLALVQGLLTVITMYIYLPWAMCKFYRWFADNLVIRTDSGEEYRLRFDGQGGDLFVTYLVGAILTGITFGIYTPWFICKMNRWMFSHAKITKNGQEVGGLEFTGEGGDLFATFLVGAILTVITLYIYLPWFQCKMWAWMAQHSKITVEGKRFGMRFSGEGGELFVIGLVGALLMMVTLYIYFFWFFVKLLKWQLSNLVIQSEGGAPMAAMGAPMGGGQAFGGPPPQGQFGGAPPQGQFGGAPPQGQLGAPPQGGYGGPPQGGFGGPPQGGYGGPPQGGGYA